MKRYVVALIVLVSVFTSHANETHQSHGRLGYHGMVLFNIPDVGYFASHLPLYQRPHDYQIVYQIEPQFPDKVENILNSGMVTILPEQFDLDVLINQQQVSLETKVYSGHFERGGELSSSMIIHFNKAVLVTPVIESYRATHAEFYSIPLGKKSALVVHKIQASPSFDALSLHNNIQTKRGELVGCEKPESMTAQSISSSMDACGFQSPIYIETRDFQ